MSQPTAAAQIAAGSASQAAALALTPALPTPRRKLTVGAVLSRVVPPIAVAAVFIGIWLFISYVVLAPRRRFLMPPPQQVLTDAIFDGKVMGDILDALWSTAQVAFVGLVICMVLGTLFAVLMSQAIWVERSFYPWAVVLQTIPILALVPLIGFWFKFGFTSRVLIVVIIALFPIITNTLFGLKSAERSHLDLLRLYGATRWQRLVRLQFPGALPAIFTGYRISAGLSVVGAIVGDFFFRQGTPGIGRLIDGYTQRLQSPQLFAAIVCSSLLGLAVFWLFGLLSRLVVGSWHESARSADSD
jgi:NitT/TauT family transport system permease protein